MTACWWFGMLTPAIRAMVFYVLSVLGAAARLPLPLLVAGFRADHAHHAMALDDLAVAAHLLDASQYLHVVLVQSVLLRAKRDPGARQVVRRHFDGHLVAGQDLDVVHPHL